ncbi:hypothetical protein DERF_000788 [Dermatophagoides farinae]|uniref:Secreted protein n=1 Tax=Dermatophagoides farinae TaxID=6954 RepID=A0A922ICA9_DERFA|nr:hypothetical protein DERF_000788 [Dermatophagoides farinae]
MLALCTAVMTLRPFAIAYSNAYSATRRLAGSVISLILCTTPGNNHLFFVVTSCSIPLYSPSVFSRIVTISTLSYNFNDRCPLPIGVANGPLRPILLRCTDSIAFSGIEKRPSGPLTGVTSTRSHSIGTLAAAKIFSTDSDISGPIPSPGIIVTVCID